MVYFDNAASAPVCKEALEAMNISLKEQFANPSSIHHYGREAREKLDEARGRVAGLLCADESEIVFTSGATEANNLAIRGVLAPLLRGEEAVHAITTAIEHPSVLETFRVLEKQGLELTVVKPGENGSVLVRDVAASVRKNTAMVSVMMVNSETGSIQPITELVEAVRDDGIVFHTDAVQGVVSRQVNVKKLGVDLLTISGHKICAPKGVGALYVRNGLKLEPIVTGGGHESGLRSGTENSPGLIALGVAAERLKTHGDKDVLNYIALRDAIIHGLERKNAKTKAWLRKNTTAPNILSLECSGQMAEFVVMKLDRLGVSVSAGSACKSGDRDASPTLLAMGISKERARSVIRVSFGPQNTKEDADEFVCALCDVLAN